MDSIKIIFSRKKLRQKNAEDFERADLGGGTQRTSQYKKCNLFLLYQKLPHRIVRRTQIYNYMLKIKKFLLKIFLMRRLSILLIIAIY